MITFSWSRATREVNQHRGRCPWREVCNAPGQLLDRRFQLGVAAVEQQRRIEVELLQRGLDQPGILLCGRHVPQQPAVVGVADDQRQPARRTGMGDLLPPDQPNQQNEQPAGDAATDSTVVRAGTDALTGATAHGASQPKGSGSDRLAYPGAGRYVGHGIVPFLK